MKTWISLRPAPVNKIIRNEKITNHINIAGETGQVKISMVTIKIVCSADKPMYRRKIIFSVKINQVLLTDVTVLVTWILAKCISSSGIIFQVFKESPLERTVTWGSDRDQGKRRDRVEEELEDQQEELWLRKKGLENQKIVAQMAPVREEQEELEYDEAAEHDESGEEARFS